MNKRSREETKRWLSRYAELKEEIKRETEEAGFWEERSKGLSALKLEPTGVKAHHKTDPVYKYITVCMECAAQCTELMEEAKAKKKMILDAVNGLGDTNQRRVLMFKYIDRLNFYQIAVRMHLSIDRVWHIHAEALDELEYVLNK